MKFVEAEIIGKYVGIWKVIDDNFEWFGGTAIYVEDSNHNGIFDDKGIILKSEVRQMWSEECDISQN